MNCYPRAYNERKSHNKGHDKTIPKAIFPNSTAKLLTRNRVRTFARLYFRTALYCWKKNHTNEFNWKDSLFSLWTEDKRFCFFFLSMSKPEMAGRKKNQMTKTRWPKPEHKLGFSTQIPNWWGARAASHIFTNILLLSYCWTNCRYVVSVCWRYGSVIFSIVRVLVVDVPGII